MIVGQAIDLCSLQTIFKNSNNKGIDIIYKTKSSCQKNFFRLIFDFTTVNFLQTRVNYSPFTIFLYKSTACG